LLENFVVLARSERHDKIAGQLDAKAQRLQGRVSRTVRDSSLLEEVPDLVEYPSVVAGTFAPEFLELPEEVLTTTLIHHQHYFPVESEDGTLKNAFLAVINTEPDNERTIARNAERVVTARLRDARFFWEADRKVPLASRIDRLSTLLFHKKLGSYKEKAERIGTLAGWIAREAFGADEATAKHAATAARLAKADLATDMVREFPELQGVMGGIYARAEGQPEEVWKAIYFHYLPVGVEADAPPSKAQLGKAAVTWAAVSLADKLDTVVGMFGAGEKPTGSRDPYGLRRAAQGISRILVDLHEFSGKRLRPTIFNLLLQTSKVHEKPIGGDEEAATLFNFMADRLSFVLESRGFDIRTVRAVTHNRFKDIRPADELQKLKVLPEFIESRDFQALATAFKRAMNITKQVSAEFRLASEQVPIRRTDGAELALLEELETRKPVIDLAVKEGQGFREAFAEAARFKPAVDRFFDEVLVMDPDPAVRENRLRLLCRLTSTILNLADISQIVVDESKQA
jgi:glycyl-tRNA synthetase beta chain